MPKLQDVALIAGCSISTASRSLSGDRRVADATRRRVQNAAESVGYRWNLTSRIQSQQNDRLVGLVIPDLDKYNYVSGASLLHDVLTSNGYRLVLICHHDDPLKDESALSSLAALRVAGIVHVPCTPGGAKDVLGPNNDIPIVELNRRSSSPTVDAIVADEEIGGFEIARHLIGLGHKRIAMLTASMSLSTNRDRRNGFVRAIDEAGLNAELCPILVGEANSEWGQEGTLRLMEIKSKTRPTAIFAASALISMGTLSFLNTHKIDVPDEISVAGFSDPEWYLACCPPMTTYEVPLLEMGHMAAQVLLNQLQPQVDALLKPTVIQLAGRLLIRSSTAPPRSH